MGFLDLVRRTSGVMPFGRNWPDGDVCHALGDVGW
jgi:hypothetical protein